jgi:HlyD family secretion protein
MTEGAVNRTTVRVASAGAIVAVLAGAIALAGACRRARVPVARATRRPLTQTLVISGRVMPPVRVNLGVVVTGTVRRRLVEVGQRVREGDPLLVLDDAEARAAAAEAGAAARQAALRLEQLQRVGFPLAAAASTQARLNYDRAERERQRMEQLAADGLVTETVLDDARKAAALGRSQLEAASVQQASTSASGVDERTTQAALEQARAAQAAAEARLALLVVRASGSGVIIFRDVEAGDVVQPGKTLLVLAVDGPTLLTMDPDERNLGAIWMGQSALASADAYPGQSFRAQVSFIGAAVDPQRGTVEVRLSVPDPPPTLRPDMTVSVELEAGRRNEALVVPAECVRDITGQTPWILVVRDGVVERRAVRTGLRGDALVEIVSGARDGDLVVPSSAGSPAPGTRVIGLVGGR